MTAAAKKFFSGKQRRGKYQASPDTTALARQKQVYCSQLTQTCCGTLTHASKDTFLPLLLRQWQTVIQLQKLDKKLAKSRRADKRRQTQAWCQEIELFASRHEQTAVWRLSRKIAGTNVGPKLRRFDCVQCAWPTATEWAEHLSSPGPQGGCLASPLLYHDQSMNLKHVA